MGTRAPLVLAAMLFCSGVQAAEDLTLAYPGWTAYLRLDDREGTPRRSLALDAPDKSLLRDGVLRLPLGGSGGFLSIEAALVERRTNPALPETTGYVLRAGLGVGMEF